MNEFEIQLENNQTAFQPGQEIRGKVKWLLQEQQEAVTLGLFWRTSGRGTQDMGVECSQAFENPSMVGEEDFSIKCPAGPYSFSGKLISIEWGLELTGEKGENADFKNLTIAPNAKEIVCTKSYDDSPSSGSGILNDIVRKFKNSKR